MILSTALTDLAGARCACAARKPETVHYYQFSISPPTYRNVFDLNFSGIGLHCQSLSVLLPTADHWPNLVMCLLIFLADIEGYAARGVAKNKLNFQPLAQT